MSQRRKCDVRSSHANSVFEDGRRPYAKQCEEPLEAGKCKETGFPQELPTGRVPPTPSF